MWDDSVEATIEHFVDNMENSLSFSKLDSILVALKSHGIYSREAILRIFHAYVSKIRQLSALQSKAAPTCTGKIHYPRIPVRQSCLACYQHSYGGLYRNNKQDPKARQALAPQTHHTLTQLSCNLLPQSKHPPSPFARPSSREIPSQTQVVHLGQKEQQSLPFLGHSSELKQLLPLATQSSTRPSTDSSDDSRYSSCAPSPSSKSVEPFSTRRQMNKTAFSPFNDANSAEFANSIIKSLRHDVAEKLKNPCSHTPDHPETMNKASHTLYNPKERLAGGAEPGVRHVEKGRLQILLGKMADIESKINVFKEKALTANRLQEEVNQLRSALDNERQLCNAKLESAAAEFRKQIEMVGFQLEICQKERTIYEKLAKKLEYELHRSEKEKHRAKRQAENLETKINYLLGNIYVHEVNMR
ncbi:unnamed protein product [Hermetia illucens]|uniref:Uncharacterized protein n=1 Tax=Hermetia illucens TaxID=343691 RepID=A0A7R8U9W2_HERIL|nr:unnamed protein product [Hermetia illucens]